MLFLFPPTKGEGRGRGDIGFCVDSVCVGGRKNESMLPKSGALLIALRGPAQL